MPWCPKCEVEYKDGVEVCVDCGTKLIDLDATDAENKCVIIKGPEDVVNKLASFIKYNDVEAFVKQDEDSDEYCLYVDKKDELQAKKIVTVFIQEEMKAKAEELAMQEAAMESEEDDDDDEEVQVEQRIIYTNSKVYQKSEEKAQEFKSSAYMLIVVGILGFAFLVMLHMGILPFSFANQTLVDIVMGALFLVFIVMGFMSFKSSKKYEEDSKEENLLTEKVTGWCDENLTAEIIDECLDKEDSEDIIYFKRTERMKELITDKYMNLHDDFLEHIIEEYYQKLFES